MKKALKTSLKGVGIVILLAVIASLGGWWYFNSTFLSFEEDYTENSDIKELTLDGYVFLDRNGNGKLDMYEDDRKTIDERVENVLNLMNMEEKIHLLKGSGLSSAMGSGNTAVPGAVGTIVPTPRFSLHFVWFYVETGQLRDGFRIRGHVFEQ